MATLLFNDSVKSTSKVRGDKSYRVMVYSDGTGSCECIDYAIRGVRGEMGPNYRCKHLREVANRLEQQGRLNGGSKPVRQSNSPVKGVSIDTPSKPRVAMTRNELTRVGRRDKRDYSL